MVMSKSQVIFLLIREQGQFFKDLPRLKEGDTIVKFENV